MTRVFNSSESVTRCMRNNKCKDTKPELMLRKELWRRGLRYRKNFKVIEGKPDIVFLRAYIAVFVDGKMWHGYDWEHQKEDFKSNRDFWIPKIERNKERDREVTEALTEQGWMVLRFWGFEIKNDVKLCADKIEQLYKHRSKILNKKKELSEDK